MGAEVTIYLKEELPLCGENMGTSRHVANENDEIKRTRQIESSRIGSFVTQELNHNRYYACGYTLSRKGDYELQGPRRQRSFQSRKTSPGDSRRQ